MVTLAPTRRSSAPPSPPHCLSARQAFNLSPERLAARKVETVDIGSQEKDFWTRIIQKKDNDPSKIRSEKLNRGPLLPGWQVREGEGEERGEEREGGEERGSFQSLGRGIVAMLL